MCSESTEGQGTGQHIHHNLTLADTADHRFHVWGQHRVRQGEKGVSNQPQVSEPKSAPDRGPSVPPASLPITSQAPLGSPEG